MPVNSNNPSINEELMKKVILAISTIALLSGAAIVPAQAYPAGQLPTMGLSEVSRIIPGAPVSVQISRVQRDCDVSVRWTDDDINISPVTAKVKATGKSGIIRINTPSQAGTYELSTVISKSCAGTASNVYLSKSIVVGKMASIVGKVSSASGFAAKSPNLVVTGSIKSGSVAVANQSIKVILKKGGVQVATQTSSTDGSGAISVSFPSINTAGVYTAVIELSRGSVYYGSTFTTSKITLR